LAKLPLLLKFNKIYNSFSYTFAMFSRTNMSCGCYS